MKVNATEYKLKRLHEMAKQLIERSVQYGNVAVDAMHQAREIEDEISVLKEKMELVKENNHDIQRQALSNR